MSPVPDEERSRLEGRPVFLKDKKMATFGGTYKTRGAMPLLELAKHGKYEVFLSWQFRSHADGHLEFMDTNGDWRSPDIAWTQRWMSVEGPEQFRRARACQQILLSDCDDNFAALPRTNIARVSTDPTLNPAFNRDHYMKVMAESTAIIASTEPLAKSLRRLGPPVHVVRNAIDLEEWVQLDPTAEPHVTGWVGGLAWRAHDIDQLKPGVKSFLADYPEWMFYHGGDSQDPAVRKVWDILELDLTTTRVAANPLCHIKDYPQIWRPLSISLIPLEVCEFNRSKSFLKFLETCASGLPCIISKGLPEQQILIDEGAVAHIADNTKPMSWYDHLVELRDPELRALEGKQNRAIAEKHSIRERWIDWQDALDEIVRDNS